MEESVKNTLMDRLSRFDRADFGTRQSTTSSPAADAGKQSAADRAEARAVSDGQLTADHLKSLGWSQEDVAGILDGPESDDSLSQVEAHLRSLGWTQSEIARLLAGPEKSHLTAEALFQQHAANPTPTQQALVKAMSQAGANQVRVDPSLLSGLDATHLVPDKPSDVQQIIAQFASLPDVQKQRFLLLMRQSQNDKQTDSVPTHEKGNGAPNNRGKTPPSSDGGVLPVVKSGLDVLGSALKGLLGDSSLGATKKGKGKDATTPKSPAGKAEDKSDEPDDGDDSDQEESTSPSDKKSKDKKDELDSSDETEDESTDTNDSSDDSIGDPESSSSGESDSSAIPAGAMDPDLEIQPD